MVGSLDCIIWRIDCIRLRIIDQNVKRINQYHVINGFFTISGSSFVLFVDSLAERTFPEYSNNIWPQINDFDVVAFRTASQTIFVTVKTYMLIQKWQKCYSNCLCTCAGRTHQHVRRNQLDVFVHKRISGVYYFQCNVYILFLDDMRRRLVNTTRYRINFELYYETPTVLLLCRLV